MSQLKEVSVLVIDDFAMEYGSDWEKEKLDELLHYRFREMLPTMVVSNKEPQATLSERLLSRFMDTEYSRIVLNSARDYRPKRKAVDNVYPTFQNIA